MADYTKIVTALEIKLNALIGRPAVIQFENTTVTLPNTGLALETFLLPAQTVYTTLGVDAKGIESGVYQINVIAKLFTKFSGGNRGRGSSSTKKGKLEIYSDTNLHSFLSPYSDMTNLTANKLYPGFLEFRIIRRMSPRQKSCVRFICFQEFAVSFATQHDL